MDLNLPVEVAPGVMKLLGRCTDADLESAHTLYLTNDDQDPATAWTRAAGVTARQDLQRLAVEIPEQRTRMR